MKLNGYQLVSEALKPNPIIKYSKHFFLGKNAKDIIQTKKWVRDAQLRFNKIKYRRDNFITSDEDLNRAIENAYDRSRQDLRDAQFYYQKARKSFAQNRKYYKDAMKDLPSHSMNPDAIDI